MILPNPNIGGLVPFRITLVPLEVGDKLETLALVVVDPLEDPVRVHVRSKPRSSLCTRQGRFMLHKEKEHGRGLTEVHRRLDASLDYA